MKGKHAIAAARRREREAVEALEAAQRELAEERQARRDAESEVLRLRALEPELERLRSGEHERQSHREEKLREQLEKLKFEHRMEAATVKVLDEVMLRVLQHMGYSSFAEVPTDLVNEWHAGVLGSGRLAVVSKHAATKLSPETLEAFERARGERETRDGRVNHGNHQIWTRS